MAEVAAAAACLLSPAHAIHVVAMLASVVEDSAEDSAEEEAD